MRLRPYRVPSFDDIAGPAVAQASGARPLAAVGVSAGPEAAGFEALRRFGQGLITSGLETRADEARKEATLKGQQDAEELFRNDGATPAPLTVRDDGTIAGAAYDKALLTGYLARVDLNAQDLAAKLSQLHPADPEAFKAAWNKRGQEWIATLPADMAPGARLKWDEMGAKALAPVTFNAHKQALGEANADLMRASDLAATQAASAWRAGNEQAGAEAVTKWRQAIDARTDLTPQEKEKARLAFQDEARRHAVLGGLDRSLKQGIDKADKYLKTFMSNDQPGMHPDIKEKLGRTIEARIQDRAQEIERGQREAEKASEQKRSRWFSDFDISLHRGERTYSDIEAAYQGGYLKPHERAAATLYLDQRHKKETEALVEIGRVNAAFTGEGLPLDPKSEADRKAVDNYFAAASQNWQGLAPNDVRARAIRYAAQPGIGILPSPVKAEIRGWLRAGTPEQKVEAANTLAQIRTANPQLLNDIAEEDLAMGNLVGDYAAAGVRPEEAVRLAEEGLRVPKADREARGGQYADLSKKYPPADYLAKEANGSWLYRHTVGSNPQVPPEMVGEFDQLARTEFKRHGNWDAARKTAGDSLRRVWGVSSLGGGTKWMKGAPESFYGVSGMDVTDNAKWMREQLIADLGTSGGMFDPSEGPLEKRVLVAPDPYGRMDSATGLPLYSIMLKSSDGILNPVLDANGKPMPWHPDWKSSPEAKRRQDELTKKVEDARTKRENRGSFPMIGEAP
ncbi:MAG: hypothetical protein HQL45_17385 [Alphaproteobacteria bacterium]|nr:hypothetical protein [Alphaproteobacteria bacterium]